MKRERKRRILTSVVTALGYLAVFLVVVLLWGGAGNALSFIAVAFVLSAALVGITRMVRWMVRWLWRRWGRSAAEGR